MVDFLINIALLSKSRITFKSLLLWFFTVLLSIVPAILVEGKDGKKDCNIVVMYKYVISFFCLPRDEKLKKVWLII